MRNQDGELVWRALLAGGRVGYADRGAGIYVQHDGPGRVSFQWGIEAQRANLELGDWLAGALRARNELTAPLRQALVSFFYSGMRWGYQWGVSDAAAEFEVRWRALGGSRHEGTVAHRVACNLLGLRRKEQISATLRSRLNLPRQFLRSQKPSGIALAGRADEMVIAAKADGETRPAQ